MPEIADKKTAYNEGRLYMQALALVFAIKLGNFIADSIFSYVTNTQA